MFDTCMTHDTSSTWDSAGQMYKDKCPATATRVAKSTQTHVLRAHWVLLPAAAMHVHAVPEQRCLSEDNGSIYCTIPSPSTTSHSSEHDSHHCTMQTRNPHWMQSSRHYDDPKRPGREACTFAALDTWCTHSKVLTMNQLYWYHTLNHDMPDIFCTQGAQLWPFWPGPCRSLPMPRSELVFSDRLHDLSWFLSWEHVTKQ